MNPIYPSHPKFPTHRANTQLHTAIYSGDLALVEQLIASGVDVEARDSNGDVPLGIAVDLGYGEIVKALLEAGAYPELGNWTTPLEAAVIQGNIEMIQSLIQAGADVNLRLEQGGTALMSAAVKGNLEVVKLLIETGADANIYSNNWGTALYLAAMNIHQEIFQYLSPLTNLEMRKWSEINALMDAVRNDKMEVLNLLADANVFFYIKEYL